MQPTISKHDSREGIQTVDCQFPGLRARFAEPIPTKATPNAGTLAGFKVSKMVAYHPVTGHQRPPQPLRGHV